VFSEGEVMKFMVRYDLVLSSESLIIEANSKDEAIAKAEETLGSFIGAELSLDLGDNCPIVEDYDILETSVEEPESTPAQAV
jgi:hypothetical protein